MLAPVLIFISALAACAIQQWLGTAHGETNVALIFDAGHYQQTARLLLDFFNSGNVSNAKLASGLILDGPVLPGLGALALFFFGKLSGLPDWQSLVNLQATLHALSAVIVYFLAGKISLTPEQVDDTVNLKNAGSRVGLVAGLAYALYPPAVLATQRFLIEPLAAFLVLTLVWYAQDVFSRGGQRKYLQSLLLGITASLLIFTKTGLAPAVLLLLTIFITLTMRRVLTVGGGAKIAALRGLFAIACGFAVPFGSWAVVTANLTGSAQLLPQRAPVLNLFVGSDLANDGFSTLPIASTYEPIAANYARSGSAVQAVVELWVQKPVATFSLALRKLSRLVSLPWNDFRRPALGFNPIAQTALYQFVGVLALASLCMGCGRGASPAFWFAALMIFGHIIFLLFESIPRYSFSSYGLTLLLAVALLARLNSRKPFLRVVAGAAMIVIAQGFTILQAIFLYAIPPTFAFALWALLQIVVVGSVAYSLGRYLWLWSAGWDEVWQKASASGSDTGSGSQTRARLNFRGVGAGLMALSATGLVLIYAAVIISQAVNGATNAFWYQKIAAGTPVNRTVLVPDSVAVRKSYLLIDGTKAIDRVKIKINGKEIEAQAVPLVTRYPARLEHFAFADQVVALMKRSGTELRRWWIVPLPAASLVPGKVNDIVLVAPEDICLYGDYAGVSQRPGYLYVSPGAAWTNNKDFEFRVGPSFWQKPLATSAVGYPGKTRAWRIILAVRPEVDRDETMPQGDFEAAGWYMY